MEIQTAKTWYDQTYAQQATNFIYKLYSNVFPLVSIEQALTDPIIKNSNNEVF